jgi:RNA polymerase-binding transcription factor DksA
VNSYTALKAKLESKLQSLLEREKDIEDVLGDPGNSDWKENALEMENDETWLGIGDMTKDEVHQIRQALNRIEHGKYGVCGTCGKAIPNERLELLPWTTSCVDCS